MKKSLQLLTKSALFVVSILMLTGATSFAQSSVIVTPGLNTIQAAMAANPGDTIILQKGKEYVVSESIEITQPTVLMGEAYSRDGTGDPPAVIRGSADPGEEDNFYIILAAADLTLIDLGFIGFTWDNIQIAGVVAATKSFLHVEASGCVVQGCSAWMITNSFSGLDWLLHDNIHWNVSTTGFDNYRGWGGPSYGGDTSYNHTYNCTYFTGGKIFLSSSTGPVGWQHADHNTYVNTWGETCHKSKMDGFKFQNCILFNSHIRGYIGAREWITGDDTLVYGGDYVSYRMLDDTLNGDCSVFPSVIDTVPESPRERMVVVTNNLKYNEARVLAWDAENDITPQPFLATAMRTLSDKFGWTIAPNWTPEEGTNYDPQFAMGEIPVESFATSWAQRIGRMDPEVPDIEVAWRPDDAPPSEFIWPLPFDFTPTNPDLMTAGTDGYPLGDLNWFGPEVVAAWEAGDPYPTSIRNFEMLDMSLMNYPNPFTGITTISYNLQSSSDVSLKIYDVTGSEVDMVVNETQSAGQHEIMFDGTSLSGGVYFCRIQAGNAFQISKLTLIK